ncbi:MAG: CheR family methyltransferase [Methylomicrobium sp.]
MIQSIPIHVTEFFRDPEAWDVLTQSVLIPLIQGYAGNRSLRIWTPACSTGEEAYSLAMLLTEQMEQWEKPVDFRIFATDSSSDIIARASDGVFSTAAIQALSPARRERFFYAADGKYRVKKSLREKLVFAPQHLLADPAFSDLDLVTCRNILIYLKPAAIEQVLTQLHSSLRMGGYLFLGRSESLSPKQHGFEVVSLSWHLYRKIGPLTGVDIPLPKRLERLLQPSPPPPARAAERAHQAILEKFELPSVLIDDQFNVLRVFGDTDAFLHLPAGQPTLNLLELAKPSLRNDLERAAAQAFTEGQAVNVDGLVDTAGGESALSLRLTPLQQGEDGRSLRLLVSFVRTQPTRDRRSGQDAGTEPPPDNTAEQPPDNWQDAFRLTIEELETSGEELQVLNEELRTVNNQLNLSNEEVNKINAQLRDKILALETQSQVLSSGAVMTLFLDQELRVQWFTSAITALFPLRLADTGREITDFRPKFENPGFIDDVQAVMQTGELRENEVRTSEGRWFSCRIRPFRAGEAAATGVAITFNDITELKHYEERVVRRNAVLKGIARIFRKALTCQNEEELGHICLDVAQEVTQSRLGFIGEVNPLTHRLDTLAISDPVGEAGRMPVGSGQDPNLPPINVEMDDLYERVLRDGKSLIINEPSLHPDPIGTPPGHPLLKAFLGVPLLQVGQTFGMIGLSNRKGGYEAEHREAVEALAPVIVLAFLRKRAEDALSAELVAMKHLHVLSSVALTDISFQQLLEAALDAMMALHDADFGYVQMYDPQTKTLQIEVQRGFAPGFTEHLAEVDAQEATASGRALASDERIIVEDVEKAPADVPWVEVARRAGYRALQSTPLLMPDGKPIGMLSTHFRQPRRFTEAELTLTNLFAREIARIIAHARAEAALRESEHKYRELFNLIDEGFCIIEVLFDAHHQPVDYRFLEVNTAFEQQTGLIDDAAGKTMRSLRPDHEEHWFEIYGRIALTGEPIRFEKPDLALGRLYAVYAFRIGHPDEHNKVAILFRDITERDQSLEKKPFHALGHV